MRVRRLLVVAGVTVFLSLSLSVSDPAGGREMLGSFRRRRLGGSARGGRSGSVWVYNDGDFENGGKIMKRSSSFLNCERGLLNLRGGEEPEKKKKKRRRHRRTKEEREREANETRRIEMEKLKATQEKERRQKASAKDYAPIHPDDDAHADPSASKPDAREIEARENLDIRAAEEFQRQRLRKEAQEGDLQPLDDFHNPKPYWLRDWFCNHPGDGALGRDAYDEMTCSEDATCGYFYESAETKAFNDRHRAMRKNVCKRCKTNVGVLMDYNFSHCFSCFREMAEEKQFYFLYETYPGEAVKQWLIATDQWVYGPDEDRPTTNFTEYNLQLDALEREQLDKAEAQKELMDKAGVEVKERIDPASKPFDDPRHYGMGRMPPRKMLEELPDSDD